MYSFKKPQNLKLLSTKLRYMLFLAQKFEDENLSKKIFSAEAEFCEIDRRRTRTRPRCTRRSRSATPTATGTKVLYVFII
jgi:hypothetical protein